MRHRLFIMIFTITFASLAMAGQRINDFDADEEIIDIIERPETFKERRERFISAVKYALGNKVRVADMVTETDELFIITRNGKYCSVLNFAEAKERGMAWRPKGRCSDLSTRYQHWPAPKLTMLARNGFFAE